MASEFKELWRRLLNRAIFTLIGKAIDPAVRLSEAAENQEMSISSLLSSSLSRLEAAKPGVRKPGLRSGGWSDESPYRNVISVGSEVWWRHLRRAGPAEIQPWCLLAVRPAESAFASQSLRVFHLERGLGNLQEEGCEDEGHVEGPARTSTEG